MFEKEKIPGVDVVPAYPGELNTYMSEKTLALSPISAGAYPGIQEHVSVIPDFCLSSVGYIRSVILRSRLPIEDLDGKKVGLTSASKTSVVLLKILLEKYYNVKPVYQTVDPDPSLDGIDAALVIGNEAMIEGSAPVQHTYDLGDLWLRKTGHPVVFAIFTVQNDVLEKEPEKIKSILDSYRCSLDEYKHNESNIVKMAGRKYPEISYDINYYYSLFKFDFTEELKNALMFYYNEAASLGLLNDVEKINFLKADFQNAAE